MDHRPKTVPIVAAFLFFATAIAVVAGVSLLFPNPLMDRLWTLNKPGEATFRSLGRVTGLPLLLIGAATCAAGVGLVQRKNWAWWLAVVLFAISGIGDAVSVMVTGDWLRSGSGIVICGVFLYSLSRSRVRAYFKQDP
jgi:hypothetical protein